MSDVYPSTRDPASISTTVSRVNCPAEGPPWGSALEGPNCTSPPPGEPRLAISRDNSCATSRSVIPTASCENVAAIEASVAAIAWRISAISSALLMIRSRSVTAVPSRGIQRESGGNRADPPGDSRNGSLDRLADQRDFLGSLDDPQPLGDSGSSR